MRVPLPYQAVYVYSGQGYNLLTPDKLHVANWLRTLPDQKAPTCSPPSLLRSQTVSGGQIREFMRTARSERPREECCAGGLLKTHVDKELKKASEEDDYVEPRELRKPRTSSPNQVNNVIIFHVQLSKLFNQLLLMKHLEFYQIPSTFRNNLNLNETSCSRSRQLV